MKRQANPGSTLVYAYGCLMPIAGWASALAERDRQRAFWDRLVDIDRAHDRSMLQAAMATIPELVVLHQEIQACTARIEALVQERRARRQAARKRIETPELDVAIGAASLARRAAQGSLWAGLKAWRCKHPDQVRALEQARREAMTTARQASNCYWGNYNRVLDDFMRARQRTRKIGRRVRPSDPRREDGCLTVQIQRTRSGLGASATELLSGQCNQVAIELDPDDPRHRRARLRMRVNEAGKYVVVPLVLHRPMPTEGRIKRVQFTWRLDGAQRRFRAAFTIVGPAVEAPTHTSQSAVGIDLGFRLLNDGRLLIATLLDTTSRSVGRVVLDRRWMAQMDYADWLMSEAATYRSAGDDCRADRLTIEARNLRAKLLRRRTERYRLLARHWCQAYAVIGLEQWDLAKTARVTTEKTPVSPLHAGARSQRHRAALSDLRTAIRQQAGKFGATIVTVAGKTTQRCADCGAVTIPPHDRSDLVWTCTSCGSQWDQDVNAARNLLGLATGEIASGPVMQVV